MKKLFTLSLILLAFACQENPEIEPIEIVETGMLNEEIEEVVEFICVFEIEEIACEEALLEEIEESIAIDLEELIQEQPVIREVPVQ